MDGKAVNRIRGFTVVELITVSAISVFVLTAVLSTYVILSQYIRDTSTQISLQAKTRIAVDKMARNMRLASEVLSVSANSITLRFIPQTLGLTGDPWQEQYSLAGDEILYSSTTGIPGTTSILKDVYLDGADTLFQYDGGRKVITINVKTKKTYLTTEKRAAFTTIVKLRNAS